MKIGAYQFFSMADLEYNYGAIRRGVLMVGRAGMRLLALPECALTGYLPL